MNFLIDNTFPDIIYFTEILLSEFDSEVISDITGDKYSVLRSPRLFDNMGYSGVSGVVIPHYSAFKCFFKYYNI